MSSYERNSKDTPDALQLNMDIISKELNDLIVTGDQDITLTQQISMTTVKTTAHSVANPPGLENIYQLPPTFISNAFYEQQQFYATPPGTPYLKFYQNNYQNVQQHTPFIKPQYYVGVQTAPNPVNNNLSNGSKFLNPSGSIQNSFSNGSDAPTYEFHYLRSRTENDKKFSNSMCSLNSQSAFRKLNKNVKQTYQRVQSSYANNSGVPFDLSALTALDTDKENYNVRHLFQLLRDLHLAISETPPNFAEDSDSQYEETFVDLNNMKSSMPSTLNVQNQVKQACRKLTIFTYEMKAILSANKVFDVEIHAECEFYLNQLQQSLNQLEMYRRIVMEHKHGKFVCEEVNAHAERLSVLLEHTNRQIREVHIRILAVDWLIGVKYRGDVYLTAMQVNTVVSQKSKFGVINDILKMTKTAETATITTTTTPLEAIKPEKSISLSAQQLPYNNKMLNAKALFNANNDIFNIYKPNQIKTSAAATATTGIIQHNRHPVFYIG